MGLVPNALSTQGNNIMRFFRDVRYIISEIVENTREQLKEVRYRRWAGDRSASVFPTIKDIAVYFVHQFKNRDNYR